MTPQEDHDFILNTKERIEPMISTGTWSTNGNNEIYGIQFGSDRNYGTLSKTPPIYYDALTDEKISVNGLSHFDGMTCMDCIEPILKLSFKNVLRILYYPTEEMKKKIEFFRKCFGNITDFIYDKRIKKPLAINGKILEYYEVKVNKDFLFFNLSGNRELVPELVFENYNYAIYDTKKHAFVENPSGFPNHKIFSFEDLNYYGDWEDGVVGYYIPNEDVLNSTERISISKYKNIHSGCVALREEDFTYYQTEFDDKTDEYLRLFGKEDKQAESQGIVQEDIERMVENVIKSLLYA